LYAIAETLSINIMDLLELTEDADDKVENELPNLIEEYKEIESQELRYVLIKSLLEGIQIYEEKVKRAEKIKIAKDLVKKGISINIILKTIGISLDEIQQI
ncbi:XRE family transcriptional regulator, partial [Wolbachia endosymbiont of Drosophila incompta]